MAGARLRWTERCIRETRRRHSRGASLRWAVVAVMSLMTVVLAPMAALASLHAQEFALVPAGPNTLSGVVTDTLGQPLSDANVFISSCRRSSPSRAGAD